MGLFIIMLLMFLSGCKKITIDKEFCTLKTKTQKITGATIELKPAQPQCQHSNPANLSRQAAIAFALMNNPGLQADFENLGIAKADLVQAGLYTNPSINSVFRFPTKTAGPGTAQTNIESVAAFRLSDLWQVPLSKNVAQDLLEIVSLRILTSILDIVLATTTAYYDCLYNKMALENALDTLQEMKTLRDQVYYRQNYGYSSDLDKYNADIKVNYLELEVIHYQMMLEISYIHLKKILGIEPTESPINTSDNFYAEHVMPTYNTLESYALQNRPEMNIALVTIQQYDDSVKLEHARVWDKVDIGVAYKQDFEKPFHGWGPYISFDLPIFDDNYAQIARNCFLLQKAQKELDAICLLIKEEVRKSYQGLEALQQEISLYKHHIIPTHKKAIAWAFEYAQTMQVNMLVAIQTSIDLYESQKNISKRNLTFFTHLQSSSAL